MGSIVKTIGKVIKKVGKALKKIAPVLLVAAAAYIGYGYMTGFQQGGWPQITEWGKSLVSGVSQGMPISEAANAAGGMVETGASTFGQGAGLGETEALMSGLDATTTALPSDTVTSTATGGGITDGMGLPDMGEATGGAATGGLIDGMGLPTEGGLLNQIQDTTNTRFTSLMDQSLYPPLSNQVSNYLDAPAKQGGIGDFFLGTAQANPMQTGWPDDLPEYDYFPPGGSAIGGTEMNPALYQASSPPIQAVVPDVTAKVYPPNYTQGMGSGLGPDRGTAIGYSVGHLEDKNFWGMLSRLGKKGLDMYKHLWEKNPGMAAWTTLNVIKTVMAALDDWEEKQSYRERHVAGFSPGNWGDLRKKYKGNLPGGTTMRYGVNHPLRSGSVGENRRQSSLKAGPQISGGVRTSAIDRKPQGLIGSQDFQRALP